MKLNILASAAGVLHHREGRPRGICNHAGCLGCIGSPLMQSSPWPTTTTKSKDHKRARNHPSLPSPIVTSVTSSQARDGAEKLPPSFRGARIGWDDRTGIHVVQPTAVPVRHSAAASQSLSPTHSLNAHQRESHSVRAPPSFEYQWLILAASVSRIPPTSSPGTAAVRAEHARAAQGTHQGIGPSASHQPEDQSGEAKGCCDCQSDTSGLGLTREPWRRLFCTRRSI